MNHEDFNLDKCTCDQQDHLRFERLLINGVLIKCESCDDVVDVIEDGTVLDQLVAELSRPEAELTVTLPQNAWNLSDR